MEIRSRGGWDWSSAEARRAAIDSAYVAAADAAWRARKVQP